MELTQEMVGRYVGGQIEVQNQSEGHLYRGEIATISVQGEGVDVTLNVTLDWIAQREGFSPILSRWMKGDSLTYDAPLMVYAVSDIGDGRLCLSSAIIGETAILYPPGVERLEHEDTSMLFTLPEYTEMSRRLLSVSAEPHLVERFYPHILEAAGSEKTPEGVVQLLDSAIERYAQGRAIEHYNLQRRLERYLRALIDEVVVLDEALRELREFRSQPAGK